MASLLWGIIITVLAFLLHLVIWRIRLPKRQTRALLLLFFSVQVFVLGAVNLPTVRDFLGPVLSTNGIPDALRIFLMCTSLCLGYVITYSAVEAESPSLVIVRRIAVAGGEGMSAEELFAEMNEELLIDPRLADLLRDRLATLQGGMYVLTSKGEMFAWVTGTFRKILNRPILGG